MSISVHKSEFGITAREDYPSGQSYARLADGSWAKTLSLDNGAGEFRPVSKYDVPARFKEAIETKEVAVMDTKVKQQLTAQQYWQRLAQQGISVSATQQQAVAETTKEKPKQATLRLG